MTDAPTSTTFKVPLAGRDIEFRTPIAGQMIILRRRMLKLQNQLQDNADGVNVVDLSTQLIVDVLDVVESLVVNPLDVEFLERAMMLGDVDHQQVMDVLTHIPGKDKPVKAPARKATKTPAKTVANRARTKP